MKRFRKLSPKLTRRLFGLAVLLGVCAMLLPLPMALLPSNSPEKDQSQPFPCQSRPCGCRSAEQCWKKCCCFNNSQKIAWAKANKVTVPEYVLAAAETEKRTSVEFCSLPGKQSPDKNVVESKRSCSRCDAKPGDERRVACDREHTDVVGGSKTTKRSQPKSEAGENAQPLNSSSKWVMAVYSAECQGQGPQVYCSIVLVIPSCQILAPVMPSMIETCSIESERMLSATLRPPVPPPKIGVSDFSV
jgi:hypothetical protein